MGFATATASLSSGLVVRGGVRRLDQRSRLVPSRQHPADECDVAENVAHDTGESRAAVEVQRPAAPVVPPLLEPTKAIPLPVQNDAAPAAEKANEATAKRAPRRKAKCTAASITIRLDPDRHLSLRLLSAIENRSAQRLLLEALDRKLGEIAGLDELVDTARRPVAA
jgi:hypothetical protein